MLDYETRLTITNILYIKIYDLLMKSYQHAGSNESVKEYYNEALT